MSLDALLLGRMTQAGETLRATLPLSSGVMGGAGALAVGSSSLWLAQPQLLGGPSVASVPLAEVGEWTVRTSRFGGRTVVLRLNGRDVTFSTSVPQADVEAFLLVLDAGRG